MLCINHTYAIVFQNYWLLASLASLFYALEGDGSILETDASNLEIMLF